jgi:3-oxoacyl-[acyl-carrier protein] reductase
MMAQKDELVGRTAFVTGAARGIGLAIARALAQRGANLAMADVDIRQVDEAAQSIGPATLAVETDVSRRGDVQRAIDLTLERFGILNILVNNAGICPMSEFDEITDEEWDRVLAINLRGAFACSQVALPHLRRSGRQGRIINIASVAGQMGGVAVGAHYVASKAGLIGLTKSLARLLAPDGVTVNCVSPSTTATDLTADWSEATKAHLAAQIPIGRFAHPEEIANAVAFLASDQAAFITGATLDVNGGLYLR